MTDTMAAIASIVEERAAQDAKWGRQRLSWPEWLAVLTEEYLEAMLELTREVNRQHWHPTGDYADLRAELVQTAAVAVAMIEHIDELTAGHPVEQ